MFPEIRIERYNPYYLEGVIIKSNLRYREI